MSRENCIENVKKIKAKILDYKSSVRTSDGKHHVIVGKINTKIVCGSKSVETILYLVSDLCQEFILGYDFWKNIGLNLCLDDRVIGEISMSETEEIKMRQLTPHQDRMLESVKQNYLCYTQYGLGRTKLETHTIDTRDAQ